MTAKPVWLRIRKSTYSQRAKSGLRSQHTQPGASVSHQHTQGWCFWQSPAHPGSTSTHQSPQLCSGMLCLADVSSLFSAQLRTAFRPWLCKTMIGLMSAFPLNWLIFIFCCTDDGRVVGSFRFNVFCSTDAKFVCCFTERLPPSMGQWIMVRSSYPAWCFLYINWAAVWFALRIGAGKLWRSSTYTIRQFTGAFDFSTGDPVASSGLCRHCTHLVRDTHTDTHTCKLKSAY